MLLAYLDLFGVQMETITQGFADNGYIWNNVVVKDKGD